MKRILALAVLAASCSRSDPPRKAAPAVAMPDEPEVELPARPIEYRLTCGQTTAIWRGNRYDEEWDKYDSLWLELPGRAPVRVSRDDAPELDSFDIFSPDCSHVLLLKSRYGPYHIVATSRLAAYLDGGKPDHVLAGERDPDSISGTGVFHDGGWISSDEVGYEWGCCDPPVFTRYKLDGTSSSKMAPSHH